MSLKVLLLHQNDELPRDSCSKWDLIVDLGRAPSTAYSGLKQSLGCETRSLHDLALEIDDLYCVRNLLEIGKGRILDRFGIDWWAVLSLEIVSDLLLIILAQRQAQQLNDNWELYTTRPGLVARVIARQLGVPLHITGNSRFRRRIRHYRERFATLDRAQTIQVIQDKFSGLILPSGRWPSRSRDHEAVILLPSAYVNASRTAVDLARRMPDQKFLLVYTRNSGRLRELPENVSTARLVLDASLDVKNEVPEMLERWRALKTAFVGTSPELSLASFVGVLDKIESLFPRAISYRNSWNRIFDAENVTGCFCTDDSNYPTLIPLILAGNRGLRTLACHHGALDYFLAIKTRYADVHLAKTPLERDYMERICGIPAEKIADAPLQYLPGRLPKSGGGKWLVFFSEPYHHKYWRSDEVYEQLLPALYQLSQKMDLELVFKIHPMESVKEHRRRLRRYLPDMGEHIPVIAGPPTDTLWSNIALALTVQSSTALECAKRDIPVFFCSWLRDAYSGYVGQFARFGVGHPLKSAEELADVPVLLERFRDTSRTQCRPESMNGIYTQREAAQVVPSV